MRHTRRVRSLTLFFCGALAVACAARSAPPSEGAAKSAAAVPAGTWGGVHVVLVASESGAAVQFDCAHGAIPGRLALGPDGRFDLAGDLVAEHGGPIRKGEIEERRPVRYTGRVEGKTMTLTVELPDPPSLGPFTLELGNPGRIVRCR
jgi:hypothetical protein